MKKFRKSKFYHILYSKNHEKKYGLVLTDIFQNLRTVDESLTVSVLSSLRTTNHSPTWSHHYH